MRAPRICVAISGGVDSSVAALLARDAGYDCAAVILRLFDGADGGDGGGKGDEVDGGGGAGDRFGGYGDDEDGEGGEDGGVGAARAVADYLGVPFIVLDRRELFDEVVITRFTAAYLSGDTPNPCIYCNRFIKFGALLDYADANGFARVATGHYARVEFDGASGRYLLKKGADAAKDQSYMLYSLSQLQLSRAFFPLGGMLKSDVRELARVSGLPNAGRRESQDICFVRDGDYGAFIDARIQAGHAVISDGETAARACNPLAEGPIVDAAERTCNPLVEGPIVDAATGAVVGRHKGAARYTVGQRKGLGIAAPEPLYVCAKSMVENKLFVGHESMLYSKSFVAADVNLIPFRELQSPLRVAVKTRYRQPERLALIESLSADEIHVEFDAPQRAITRGQAAVFYDGDTVIGGGVIR